MLTLAAYQIEITLNNETDDSAETPSAPIEPLPGETPDLLNTLASPVEGDPPQLVNHEGVEPESADSIGSLSDEHDQAPTVDVPDVDLITHARQLGITNIDDTTFAIIDHYRRLLIAANETMNLTRHTTVKQFVERDLLDSYQLAQLIEPGKEVLDFGTGGGVPGLLIAILRPDIDVSVCDNVGKKMKVVSRMVAELGLNVPVYTERMQNLLGEMPFDILVARAVGPLTRICTWMKSNWHTIDRLLAIKGPRWVDERAEARHKGLLNDVELRKLVSYPMPGTESHSVIVQLRRKQPEQDSDQ